MPICSPELPLEVDGLTLGAYLGKGMDRTVYALDRKTAVKVCWGDCKGPNRAEWAIWHAAGPLIRDWLVEPFQLLGNGRSLVVRRGAAITDKQRPMDIPDFFGDTKTVNWVQIGGSILLADYSSQPLLDHLGLDWEQFRGP